MAELFHGVEEFPWLIHVPQHCAVLPLGHQAHYAPEAEGHAPIVGRSVQAWVPADMQRVAHQCVARTAARLFDVDEKSVLPDPQVGLSDVCGVQSVLSFRPLRVGSGLFGACQDFV